MMVRGEVKENALLILIHLLILILVSFILLILFQG